MSFVLWWLAKDAIFFPSSFHQPHRKEKEKKKIRLVTRMGRRGLTGSRKRKRKIMKEISCRSKEMVSGSYLLFLDPSDTISTIFLTRTDKRKGRKWCG